MLYSLMSPESGRVLVDGRDVATDPVAARRALGVLPDARGVYKRMTERENNPYFGELHGLPRANVDASTGTMADPLQMEDVLGHNGKDTGWDTGGMMLHSSGVHGYIK